MAHCALEDAWHSSALLPGRLRELDLGHARIEAKGVVGGIIRWAAPRGALAAGHLRSLCSAAPAGAALRRARCSHTPQPFAGAETNLHTRAPPPTPHPCSSSSATLQSLNLGHTQPPDLACLAHATALTSLDLSSTPTTSPALASLAGCTRLSRLNLSGTKVDWMGAPLLLALPGLQDLSLAGAAAVDDEAVSWLQQLTGLTRLDLSDTGVKDLGWDAEAAAAGRARAASRPEPAVAVEAAGDAPGSSGSGGSGGDSEAVQLHGWGLLQRLIDLDLSGAPVTAAGCQALAALAGAGRLRRLQLGGAGVDGAALRAVARLGGLQKLRLVAAGVADGGLAALAALQEMRVLALERCLLITPPALAQLAAQLPQARQVSLDGAVLRLPRRGEGGRPGGAPSPAGAQAPPAAARAGRGGASGQAAAAAAAAQRSLLQRYDERLVYSREALVQLQGEMQAAGGGSRGAQGLVEALPRDLRLDTAW
jgi:hypothetical protein